MKEGYKTFDSVVWFKQTFEPCECESVRDLDTF